MSRRGPQDHTHSYLDDLIDVVDREMKRTVGCTDPSAIGLAAAAAAAAYRREQQGLGLPEAPLQELRIETDVNIYKNAVAVGIPGTGEKGIEIAAALGAVIADVDQQLMIFRDLSEQTIAQARELIRTADVIVSVREEFASLTIAATLVYRDGSTARAKIAGSHDRILYTEVNGRRTVYQSDASRELSSSEPLPLESIEWLIEHVTMIDEAALEGVREGFRINLAAAHQGLSQETVSGDVATIMGLYGIRDRVEKSTEQDSSPISDMDAISCARVRVAAATRLRMSGTNVPIMACGGSGNHGITFFISMVEGWRLEGIRPDRSLLHAAAMGMLLLHQIKQYTGVLTPMCGCAISSGLAVSAAVTWGLGGTSSQMLQAMNIVLSTLGGVVCDGAKPACAFKTSLSAQIALEAAKMAAAGVFIPEDEGLSSAAFPQLLESIRTLHQEGMAGFDTAMVSIITRRSGARRESSR
jgi:L-cysteine desulfidase